MQDHYTKTYSVESGHYKGKPRWYVVYNGSKTSLHYARHDFAMKQSEIFCKACHKPFMRSNGDNVTFSFKQV